MKSVNVCLVLMAAFVGICSAVPVNTDESEARKFIRRVNKKLDGYMYKAGRTWYVMKETSPWHMLGQLDTCFKAADDVADIVRTSLTFDTSNFEDESLTYKFEQIKPVAEEAILGRHPVEMIYTAIDAFRAYSAVKHMPSFSDQYVRLTYYPGVHKQITNSRNEEELKYYWEIYRKKNSDSLPYRLHAIYDGLAHAANATEMTGLDFWMKGFDLNEMERLMKEVQPLYLQLHAFIRNQLLKKYGDSVIKADGPIPDHLFQQVLAQAWSNGSIFDEMFPHENLPSFDEIIYRRFNDASRMYKNADGFYRSLGFIPNVEEQEEEEEEEKEEDIFESRIKKSVNQDEGDCKPIIMDQTSDAEMRFCHKTDFRSYLQAHGYMGQMYYAFEKKNLHAYFMRAHHLEYPVGEAVILSASTFSHLKKIGLLPRDAEITDDMQFNRLFRMAIHTLLNIPMHYVHTKAMADVFEGKIKFGSLNEHYWSLMDEYVGVEPPTDRDLNAFDFSFKFYVDLHKNRQAKKFYGEILGYQMYKRLCQISGKYPNEALYNCDFYESKEAGEILRNMMQLGSSKPRHEVLETLFPEDSSITAESLLEYYNPIQNWLDRKNQQDHVNVGWTHSTKKISQVSLPGIPITVY